MECAYYVAGTLRVPSARRVNASFLAARSSQIFLWKLGQRFC
jgi:hypothetical protein